MNDYYSEILEDIETLIAEKKVDEALFLVRKELSMPYIPQDVEQRLIQYKKECVYLQADREKDGEESMDSLLRKLKRSPAEQLMAANKLSDRNLRICVKEIQDWFQKDCNPEAAALIINAIAEQEINEEFQITKNGVEYVFDGDSVTPVMKSEGFLYAIHLIDEWFMDNPSYLEMARTLLIHDAYLQLPLTYEKEEGFNLAKSACLQVCDLMNDEESKSLIETRAVLA